MSVLSNRRVACIAAVGIGVMFAFAGVVVNGADEPTSGNRISAPTDESNTANRMSLQPPLPEVWSTGCMEDGDCLLNTVCIDGDCYVPKHRYVSFIPNNADDQVAYRIEMPTCTLTPYEGSTFTDKWVGEPELKCSTGLCDWVSAAVNTPVIRDWSGEDLVQVGDCEIVPRAFYEISAADASLTSFSAPLVLPTTLRPGAREYGDVVGGIQYPGLTPLPPDGYVSIKDVSGFKFAMQVIQPQRAPMSWIDVHGLGPGERPNYILNVSDLTRILLGFRGDTYDMSGDHLDPALCP